MKIRAHILVEGFVQRVGFRWWCLREAEKTGITGWVRNLLDGRAEAVFEGSKDKLEEMLEKCREGSWAAKPTHIDSIWEQPTGEFDSFKILPSE